MRWLRGLGSRLLFASARPRPVEREIEGIVAIIDAEMSTVRRKLLGAAGSFCRGATYIRMKPTPCDAWTRNQTRTRALWARITRAWRLTLTAGERERWDYEAEWWTWYDEQQQYRWLCGYEFFCAVNGRTLLAGLPLFTEPNDLEGGWMCGDLTLAFLTASSVRLTFTENVQANEGLVVYARFPTSAGEGREPAVLVWWRESVPAGWRWLGFGGLGVQSPVDMSLPRPVASGTKCRVIACLMNKCGLQYGEWAVAEAVA